MSPSLDPAPFTAQRWQQLARLEQLIGDDGGTFDGPTHALIRRALRTMALDLLDAERADPQRDATP